MNGVNKAVTPHARAQAWQAATLSGLSEGLKRNKMDYHVLGKEQNMLVESAFSNPSQEIRKASLQMLKVIGVQDSIFLNQSIGRAVQIAKDKRLSNEKRAEAIQFMTLANPAPYASVMESLIVPQEDPSIQLAALKLLGRVPDETSSRFILKNWEILTPEIREEALNTFMINSQRITLLLNAVESNLIKPASIGWPRSVQLMSNGEDHLRDKARLLLTKNDKDKVNKAYEQALTLKGEVSNGKLVYMQQCALCHQVRSEIGVAYGPDLGTVHNWVAKDLMANILDPSLSIAPGFDLWEVVLKQGDILQGMIVSETSAAIQLRTGPGIEKTINRQEVQSLKVLNMSVMPALASELDHQKMADLIAFLRNSKSEKLN